MSDTAVNEKKYQAVIPHLVVHSADEAIAFYQKAFGAVEVTRMPAPDGKRLMHASVEILGCLVMLVDEFPEWNCLGPKALNGKSPVTLHLSVDNVDKVMETAAAAGATVTMPPADMFWGDRYGQLQDPFGHQWSLGCKIENFDPAKATTCAV